MSTTMQLFHLCLQSLFLDYYFSSSDADCNIPGHSYSSTVKSGCVFSSAIKKTLTKQTTVHWKCVLPQTLIGLKHRCTFLIDSDLLMNVTVPGLVEYHRTSSHLILRML